MVLALRISKINVLLISFSYFNKNLVASSDIFKSDRLDIFVDCNIEKV